MIWLMRLPRECIRNTRSTWLLLLRHSTNSSTRWTARIRLRTKLQTIWLVCSVSAIVITHQDALPRLCSSDHQVLVAAHKLRKSPMPSVLSTSVPKRFSRLKQKETLPLRSSYKRLRRTVSPSLMRSFFASSTRELDRVTAVSAAGSLMVSLKLNLRSTFSSP